MSAAQPAVGRPLWEPSNHHAKSGQPICYETGHFYLLLTARETVLTVSEDVPIMRHVFGSSLVW